MHAVTCRARNKERREERDTLSKEGKYIFRLLFTLLNHSHHTPVANSPHNDKGPSGFNVPDASNT